MSNMKKNEFSHLLQGRFEPATKSQMVPDFAYSPLNKYGLLYKPIIDQHYVKSENKKPNWPKDKPFAVCLTHDVDAISEINVQQNIRSIWKLIKTGAERPLGESLRWILIYKLNALKGLTGKADQLCNFEKWLDLEQEYGASSTFFFAPEQVNLAHESDCMYTYDQKFRFREQQITVAELMQTMDQQGWEVGLHPSWFAHDNVSEMRSQKQQVERVLGHEIESVRQHFLKYDPQKTPQTQFEAGFRYDSTLGFNDNVGFRRGSSYPFNCYDLEGNKALPLLQIPLTAQDGALMLSEKGLRLDPDSAVDYVRLMMEAVKEVGGVLTLSWHPHTINRSGFWQAYQNVLKMLKQEDPWFATVGEIGHWWQENNNIDLLEYTRNLEN